AIDISAKGAISKTSNQDKIKYALTNYQLGPSSPVIEGNTLYAVTAESSLHAFNLPDGKPLWEKKLGTIQKASPVFEDGKLYVGTENGKFYILKPGPTGCEVLDEDQLGPVEQVQLKSEEGDELIAANEQILASAAVSRGRVYLVSTKAIYCIGKKAPSPALPPVRTEIEKAAPDAAAAYVQIVPADLVMQPGQTAKFKVRLFDNLGRFIREEQNASWSMDGLKGSAQGTQFTADGSGVQAGMLKAAVGGATGVTRIRVIPSPPMAENFDAIPVDGVPRYWISAGNKYNVKEIEGNKVLVKGPNPPIFKRTRSLFGPISWSNYSV